MGIGVWGLGFWVWGFEFRVCGLGFEVQGLPVLSEREREEASASWYSKSSAPGTLVWRHGFQGRSYAVEGLWFRIGGYRWPLPSLEEASASWYSKSSPPGV